MRPDEPPRATNSIRVRRLGRQWQVHRTGPASDDLRVRGDRAERVEEIAIAGIEAYDRLMQLEREAEREPLAETRKRRIARILLATAPGLGPIRVAQPLPIVVTPHRFLTRRQFRAYCGSGIVMRSSSDWVQAQAGGQQQAPLPWR